MGFFTLLPSPVTDGIHYITPNLLPNYPQQFCVKIHLKLGDCLEAYGIEKGKLKCADLFYDLQECRTGKFQQERFLAMQKERMRQYQAGKRKTPFEEHPPLDSYMYI